MAPQSTQAWERRREGGREGSATPLGGGRTASERARARDLARRGGGVEKRRRRVAAPRRSRWRPPCRPLGQSPGMATVVGPGARARDQGSRARRRDGETRALCALAAPRRCCPPAARRRRRADALTLLDTSAWQSRRMSRASGEAMVGRAGGVPGAVERETGRARAEGKKKKWGLLPDLGFSFFRCSYKGGAGHAHARNQVPSACSARPIPPDNTKVCVFECVALAAHTFDLLPSLSTPSPSLIKARAPASGWAAGRTGACTPPAPVRTCRRGRSGRGGRSGWACRPRISERGRGVGGGRMG